MRLFSSLTNRIFFGSALLAVGSIAIAIYNVNVAVTRQAEQELRRGLDEAGTIIDEYHQILVDHFTREARLIADLPRLKAGVDTNNPVTVQPLAEEYQRQLAADLLLITGRSGQTLAEIASANVSTGSYASLPGFTTASIGRESSSFWPHTGGILQVVTVPIYIGLQQPEMLGTLSVGVSLDEAAANRFQRLTNSDIAFGMNGAIRASTLPKDVWPSLAPLLSGPELSQSVPLGDQDYIAKTSALKTGPVKLATTGAAASGTRERRCHRHHPAIAYPAPRIPQSAARAPRHHRRCRGARGHAPQLRHRPDDHADRSGPSPRRCGRWRRPAI